MSRAREIAQEVTEVMPQIIRRLLFEFFHNFGIPQAQLFVLIAIFQKGPQRFSALSDNMQVSAPTMTGIVDRLEQSGHVRRIPDPDDRRAIQVHLTSKGKRTARKLYDLAVDRWTGLLEKISFHDSKTFVDILRRMRDVL
ncbi:MAG: MarR family transcriptional regulator [Elusimicrobia bacterium]|nr:MarR family transcriptional regulator [Elusimicrobiota bacterium]